MDDNVIELRGTEEQKRRYAELKAAKPTPGSDDWKELMNLGRIVKGRPGGTRGGPEARARRSAQAETEKKIAGLYEDAYKVIKAQLDIFLAGSDIVCDECQHVIHINLGRNAETALKAAMRVIDQKEGKAAQTVRNENVEVKEIRYVTAAAPEAS